jgi:hypothetical protein
MRLGPVWSGGLCVSQAGKAALPCKRAAAGNRGRPSAEGFDTVSPQTVSKLFAVLPSSRDEVSLIGGRPARGPIAGASRDQRLGLPAVLDASMAAANPVCFLAAVGDRLERDPFGVPRVQPAATGRPSAPPGAWLPLSIDDALHRLRSSHRWEQALPRQVALLGRLRQGPPNCKTITDVRHDTTQACTQGCRTLTLRWQVWGVGGERRLSMHDGPQSTAACAPRAALGGTRVRPSGRMTYGP